MTNTQADFHRHGAAALAHIHACSASRLADDRDIDLSAARRLKKVAARYFGPADSPAVQKRTLKIIDSLGHSLERLIMIDTHTKKLPARGIRWQAREELCSMSGSFADVKARALSLVEEHATLQPPTPGLHTCRPRHGISTLIWRTDQRTLGDLLLALDNRIADDPALADAPRSQARGIALQRQLFGARPSSSHDGATSQKDGSSTTNSGSHPTTNHGDQTVGADGDPNTTAPIAVPKLRTMVVVGVHDYIRILSGYGDDVILALTDGTTITGADYLSMVLAEQIDPDTRFGLFHPTAGGVNTYRARFANEKQRDLAMAENPVCAWPGCQVPGYLCQMHHMRAHRHEGSTTPENLVALCAYHNGCNDDDPHAPPRRGRMVRVDGHARRRSVDGFLDANDHRASTLGAMRLLDRNTPGPPPEQDTTSTTGSNRDDAEPTVQENGDDTVPTAQKYGSTPTGRASQGTADPQRADLGEGTA